jgi:hypothetical protein
MGYHTFSVLERVAKQSYVFVASAKLIQDLILAKTHYAMLARVDDWSPFSLRIALESSVKLYMP